MDLFRDTWALASGGLIKPPKIEAIDIDVEATKERHSHAGDGLHIIENNEK